MSQLRNWIDNIFYPESNDNWDNAIFRQHILKHLKPSFTVLDLGAGAGIVSQMNFRGKVKRMYGVDLDERVKGNIFLDEAQVASVYELPYPDATFDLIFTANVMEHIEKPLQVFNEVQRVLKPGGKFLVKVPNKKHYVPLIARITPHWFHQFINKKRGREEEDTFPTFYRANTINDLKKISHDSSLEMEEILPIEGRPEYLRINPLLYLFGLVYERVVNSFYALSSFRVILIGIFKKTN